MNIDSDNDFVFYDHGDDQMIIILLKKPVVDKRCGGVERLSSHEPAELSRLDHRLLKVIVMKITMLTSLRGCQLNYVNEVDHDELSRLNHWLLSMKLLTV